MKGKPPYAAEAAGGDQAMTNKAITIYSDGVWAGTGRWDGKRITDCPATLGPRHADDQDASERAYDAIQGAVGIGDQVAVDGITYTWDLEAE